MEALNQGSNQTTLGLKEGCELDYYIRVFGSNQTKLGLKERKQEKEETCENRRFKSDQIGIKRRIFLPLLTRSLKLKSDQIGIESCHKAHQRYTYHLFKSDHVGIEKILIFSLSFTNSPLKSDHVGIERCIHSFVSLAAFHVEIRPKCY